MLTNKIQHIPVEDHPEAGAEIIVMHPETKARIKPATSTLHKIPSKQPAMKMPAQPTAYLRPKKHDFL